MKSNSNILVKLKNAGIQLNKKWLVQNVSLQVERGKIVTLIGPNGSEKAQLPKLHLVFTKKLMERLKNTLIKLDMFLKKFQLIGLYH